MQPSIGELIAGPWAIDPGRLQFVRAALEALAAGHGLASMHQARTYAACATIRRPTGNGAIAVLPLYGILAQRADARGEAFGLLSLWHFTQAFRAALADDTIGGIVIDVDSPGGSVYGVMELAEEIYRSRTRKPIFAIANSLAASGAYWIASAANEFYVTPGGEVGGIGVYDIHTDLSKGLANAGVKTTLISAGRYKVEGNPFQPLGADAQSAMQKRVDEYYGAFVAAVAKYRNAPESVVRGGMGQGRLLVAEHAMRENMVDGISALDDVAGKLARRIGPSERGRPPARTLKARQRVVERSNRRPSDQVRSATVLTAARRREIELLSL